MHKLRYSPEALNDLDEIWEYIYKELQNPVAAQNIVAGILDKIDKLRDFPEMGSLLSSVIEVESDYRHLVCGNYKAFYRVDSMNVFIDRIFYDGRDYIRILFDGLSEK